MKPQICNCGYRVCEMHKAEMAEIKERTEFGKNYEEKELFGDTK